MDYLKPNIKYGRHTYGRLYSNTSKVEVGNFCSIAGGVSVRIYNDHRTDWITTYPFDKKWGITVDGGSVARQNKEVIIENDVWIGFDAVLLHDTILRNGCIVGAHSVVCGEIPPYAIVVGNPAKVIKYRFEQDVIDKLLEIKWWDWPDEKIQEFVPLLCSSNLDEFFRRIYG